MCLQAGDREWHVYLPSISAAERGKERVGVTVLNHGKTRGRAFSR